MPLSTTELSQVIKNRTGSQIPAWKLRRVLDDLDGRGLINILRVGGYRTLPDTDTDTVIQELRRIGWLKPLAESATC